MIIVYFIIFLLIILGIFSIQNKFNRKNNLSYVCILFVISITVIFIISRSFPKKIENFKVEKISGRTIWLLWLPGWDKAPLITKKVKESWEKLNPEWKVVLLDENNFKNYIDINLSTKDSNEKKKDFLKLNILAKHGGIWADPQVLCMMPVDDWIYDVLDPTGFWMYHGDKYGVGPASWFIITIRQSYIIQKWCYACDALWGRGEKINIDNVFINLCKIDKKFSQEWDDTPYLWCQDKGGANTLIKNMNDIDQNNKKLIMTNPPYVINNVFGIDNLNKGTNIWTAIEEALGQNHAPYPMHKFNYSNKPKTFKDKVHVAADCGHDDGVKIMSDICNANNIEMVIYDKCNFCKHIPDGIYCRPLRNTGREQATYLYFVIKHYNNLPNIIFFCPANTKHNRVKKLKAMIENNGLNCGNGKVDPLGGKFIINKYEGKKVDPAFIRPFKNWFEYYIDDHSKAEKPCWNGTMRTSKERIMRNPLYKFINLYKTLIDTNNPESGHFMERAMANVF